MLSQFNHRLLCSDLLQRRSLSSSLHQGLTEVLLGVAMIWAVFQSQFKVCDGLQNAAFVSIPVNHCTHSVNSQVVLIRTLTNKQKWCLAALLASKQTLWHCSARMDSQSSSRHQCFHIVGVYIQGLVVLVHGFHMSAVFKMIHTWTHAVGTKATKERRINRSTHWGSKPACMHWGRRVRSALLITDYNKFMIICMHLILWVSITTSGPMMKTVSSELQKQNPPLWRICCKGQKRKWDEVHTYSFRILDVKI